MWFDPALITLGGFLAALVIGGAGFAFAIVVTGIWIYVLPPAAIVLLAAICATLLHAASVRRFRRVARRARFTCSAERKSTSCVPRLY